MMKSSMRWAAAAAGFLTAASLWADPASCHLVGTVTDSSGAPLEGVTLTITTPSLKIFKTTQKTDAKGNYSVVLQDCTMPYHVEFEKDGFIKAGEDKKIPIADQGTLNMKLLKTSEGKPAPGAAPAGAHGAAPAKSSENQAIEAFNEGAEANNKGDKATAETKFLEAVQKNPDLSAGWNALAILAFDKKDWGKTLEYGQKALDLDPSMTGLYPMLAEAAKQSGDKKAAAEWAAKNAEANPDSPDILFNKGIEAFKKKDWKDAETSLAKAVEVKPDFANAHFYLGMASFNLSHKASAKEHFEKYLELEPTGKDAATAKEFLTYLK